MIKKEAKGFLLRLPPNIRESATRIAKEKRISLNQLITEIVAEYTGDEIETEVIENFRQRIESLEREVKELKEK